MRVGFYQFAPAFGDAAGNLAEVREALARMEADLIVLPELCNTGYQFVSEEEARGLAEPIPGGPTCEALAVLARERRAHIVAGVAERDGEGVYNSCVLAGPEGYVGKYRKLHLFYEEKRWFRPGEEPPPVFDAGGVKLGLMICFDWIFPETARMLALQGADVICHPANLVFTLCHQAMVVRCIENRVFAVTCNRTGRDARKPGETLTYTGGSQVVDPRGKVLARAGAEGEEGCVVEIAPERARDKDFNEYNNLVRDRRVEVYEMLSRPVFP
ncbi:MAG: acyltransferase [Candidatus Tectomicrobia bacterium]|nr:acyltransferase [Candidatus Tectomicrobia bacterium]